MQALPCPKCGFETEETKSLSMSTRTHKVDFFTIPSYKTPFLLQFGRKQGKEFNGGEDDDEDDEGGYGGFGGYGGYGGHSSTCSTTFTDFDNIYCIGGAQVAYGDLGETDGAFGGHFDDTDEDDYDDDDDSEEESEEEEKK